MNFTYENQGHATYLSYTFLDSDTVDTMSLGMLTNNKIPGIAHAIYTQMDEKKYIKYNVSAHIAISQFFSGTVNRKRLINVFKGIVNAMLSAEDYMLNVDNIYINLDYMFVNVSNYEVTLICLPLLDKKVNEIDLGTFFKNIMFNTQFDQAEDCDYVAKIMNYLNSAPNFSIEDFKNLLIIIENPSMASASAQANTNSEEPQTTTANFAPVQPSAPVANINSTQATPVAQPVPTPVVPQSAPVAHPVPTPVVPQSAPVAQPVPTPVVPQAAQAPVVPQPRPIPPVAPVQQTTPVENQKKRSVFGLFGNHHKENVTHKNDKKVTAPVPTPASKVAPGGFAVPGQAAPAPAPVPQKPVAPVQPKAAPGGFAVPGQAAPAPAPVPQKPMAPVQPKAASGRFAVPGQAAPTPVAQPMAQPVAPMPIAPVAQPVTPVAPPSSSMSFGETTVLGGASMGAGETTVLSASDIQQIPYLTRIKTNERININVPFFKLGKERSYADYCISDNPAISRSHANVISRDGQYFVVDANSTNHTFVNGTMIQSGVETQINHGDKIRLGNEEFEFKLY